MALSKKQKRDRWNYFGTMLVCAILITVAFLFFCGCESKPDQEKEVPGTTTLENADSLETTNPDYLEEYFNKWEK